MKEKVIDFFYYLQERQTKIFKYLLFIGITYYIITCITGSLVTLFYNLKTAKEMLYNPILAFQVVWDFQGITKIAWIILNAVILLTIATLAVKFHLSSPGLYLRSQREKINLLKDATHGTAKWMDKREAKKILKFGWGQGILFGKFGKRPVRLNCKQRNCNVIVFGAPGCRKTRGLVIPNMLQAIENEESLIITDPKGEIHRSTSEFFRKHGYKIKKLNLINMQNSDRWNPLDVVENDLDAQILADVIIANTTIPGIKKIGGDPFWTRGEQNLLKALVLYVKKEYPNPEDQNMDTLYTLLTSGVGQLDMMFRSLKANHPAKIPYNIYNQVDSKVKTGIVMGLGTRLQLFTNKDVRKLTSKSDINLELPGKEKCVYYCIISDKDMTFSFLASLFFSFLFIKLMNLADQHEGPCPVPVSFILDEFCNIGNLPDFTKKIATVRSRGLALMMIVQSLPQLKNRYPNEEWEEIIACSDSLLVFGVNDNQTAKYISDLIGISTVSKLTARNKILEFKNNMDYSYTTSQRRLLNPDEIRKMPRDEGILVIGGCNPARIRKIDFTEHPLGKEIPKDLSSTINEEKEKSSNSTDSEETNDTTNNQPVSQNIKNNDNKEIKQEKVEEIINNVLSKKEHTAKKEVSDKSNIKPDVKPNIDDNNDNEIFEDINKQNKEPVNKNTEEDDENIEENNNNEDIFW